MPSSPFPPKPPIISWSMLLKQCKSDVHGKEVQSAATYSYLWSADQIGHMGVGIAFNFLAVFVVYHLLALFHSNPWPPAQVLGFLIVFGFAAYWEFTSYRTDVKHARPPFALDKRLLTWNAVTAAGYMILGDVMAVGFHIGGLASVFIVGGALVVAFAVAPWWLRQKIIWQKAGLPYLFRLSDTHSSVLEEPAQVLETLIAEAAPPCATPRQVLLAGPVGSGRTSLATAIGTEFAFRNKSVRYLTLDRLIEFATAPKAHDNPPVFGDDTGPLNIEYWTWLEAQVLVIDDIGPVIGALPGPGDLQTRFDGLLDGPLAAARSVLAERHTVWIVGDIGTGEHGMTTLARLAEKVARFCGSEYDPKQWPLAILLSGERKAARILNRRRRL